MTRKTQPWHTVQRSPLHGNGVFAARDIPAGTRIIEYTGALITPEEADEKHPANPDDPFHTFYFSLSCGKVIDGAQNGNDARWVNHSCSPNCETEENAAGTRVFVVALRDIAKGEELFYDYGLVMDEEITQTLKDQYRCLCGSDNCRGTMLALTEETDSAEADSTDTTHDGIDGPDVKQAIRQLKKLRKKHKKLKKRVRTLEKKMDQLLHLMADPSDSPQ